MSIIMAIIMLISILIQIGLLLIAVKFIGTALKKYAEKSFGKKWESAVPKQPKKKMRFQGFQKQEKADCGQAASRTACEPGQECSYRASYSKGRPGRVGLRGDYETVVPEGKERIRCAYCGAENFIPEGTKDHYHCYFCWEKL